MFCWKIHLNIVELNVTQIRADISENNILNDIPLLIGLMWQGASLPPTLNAE